MDGQDFDRLARLLNVPARRRRALGGGVLALAGGAGLTPRHGATKKRRKGGKKCKPRGAALPTCTGFCDASCYICVARADAPPLCAALASQNPDTSCTSDQDCVDVPNFPYCFVSYTIVDGGLPTPIGVDGSGHCGQVSPCGA